MSRPSGLGRGLGALIPTEPIVSEGTGAYRHVAIDSIEANPSQPRASFDEETLASLAASIRELGVLQPLLVREEGSSFELIAGERRLRAAKLAGLSEVPVIVRQADDRGSLEQALVENLHRQDLNPLEEAAAYQQLIDEFSLTQKQVATRVGKSRSTVANTMRLLGLPTPVQRLVTEGVLSAGHARALLALDQPEEQERLAQRIVRDELTVRRTEQLVRERIDTEETPTRPSRSSSVGETRDPAVLELEELLSNRLSTSVRVSLGAGRGKIVIDYADVDDLERIYRVISGE